MKYILLLLALSSFSLLFLITSTTANSPLLVSHFWLLIVFDIVLSLSAIVVIGIKIKQLLDQYRFRLFGARLKMRLVILVAAVSFFPCVVVYSVSISFVTHSIESWFDVNVEKALGSGIKLGRDVLNSMLYNLKVSAQDAALTLGDYSSKPSKISRYLETIKEGSRADNVFIIDNRHHVSSYVSDDNVSLEPKVLPTVSQIQEAQNAGSLALISFNAAKGLYELLVIVPTASSAIRQLPSFLILQKKVSLSLTKSLVSVENTNRDYATLKFSRGNLKNLYIVSLTLLLFLTLLVAVLAGIYYSDLLSAPLFMLFQGTEAVTHGDFSPRQFSGGKDELSLLTRLFHHMTCQLRDAQTLAQQKSLEIENERAYLSSILDTLTAGVMTFDEKFYLVAINKRAQDILEDDFSDLTSLALSEWPRLKDIVSVILTNFSLVQSNWRKQITYVSPSSEKALLMQGAFFKPDRQGFVVVFDDLTALVHAQKMMVWGEVAQRLAHEIKNPLMPIRLSAERLQIKLQGKLEVDDRAMLEKSIELIVRQVDAMKDLINDFRDLTRLPMPSLKQMYFNDLIAEVVSLYEQDGLSIFLDIDPQNVPILADEKQVRQVLHNLLRNACDSLIGYDHPRIVIKVFYQNTMAYFSISDNGCGFSSNIIKKAFEPYVTNKPRGTGLGLAIVKKIIDEHNGTIEIRNNDGGGSTVIFALPCVRTQKC